MTEASQQTSPLQFTIQFSGSGGGAGAAALGALGLQIPGVHGAPASQPKPLSQAWCTPVKQPNHPGDVAVSATKRMCRSGCDGKHELSDVTRHARVSGLQYCVTKDGDFTTWLRTAFPEESEAFITGRVNKRQKLAE